MSIAAALNGTLARVLVAAGDPRKCGIRTTDGRPPAGFQGDFYYGVYYLGWDTDSSRMLEDHERAYRIGVDITHRTGSVPTRKQGGFLLETGQLLDRADRLPLYLMDGVDILVAANAARPTPINVQFFEAFSYVTCGKVEEKSLDWIGGDTGEDEETAPTVLAVSLTFGGLKCGQLLSELP